MADNTELTARLPAAAPAPTTGRPGRLTCRKPIVIDAHAFLYEVEANTG